MITTSDRRLPRRGEADPLPTVQAEHVDLVVELLLHALSAEQHRRAVLYRDERRACTRRRRWLTTHDAAFAAPKRSSLARPEHCVQVHGCA